MATSSQSPVEDQFPTEGLETLVLDAERDGSKKTVVCREHAENGFVSVEIQNTKRERSTSNSDHNEKKEEQTTESLKTAEVRNRTSEIDIKISTLQSQVKILQEELTLMTTERDKCEREKDILQARLSEAFSVQVCENNPGIANLSDHMRPTVIAEKYSQLYDDDWTDGFQALNESGNMEEESIQILHDTVKKCYVFCVKQADMQRQKVVTSLLSFNSTKHYNKTRCFDDLNISQRAALNNLLRKTSVLTKETAINEYCEQLQNTSDKDQALLPFTEKCVEICWHMVLKSPPVYIEDCDKYTRGSDFNTDVFRYYTRTGTKLDFVVWPPLYLHKDGPLLSKGVAQPLSV